MSESAPNTVPDSGGNPTSPSRWVKCITLNGNLRGLAIEATEVVQSLISRHQLGPAPSLFLAEATVGAFMLGSYCKSGERVNLNIQGAGLCSQALVESFPDGRFRGYVIERSSGGFVEKGQGRWGSGLISVLRSKTDEGAKPWIGTVPLVTGHLAKDLTYYWAQSEQVPSAIGILIRQDHQGKVVQAAGFLVQAMPGASSDEISLIEDHLKDFQGSDGNLGGSVEVDPADPMKLLGRVFQSTPFVKLEETPLRFECSCSQARVENAMLLVGAAELRSMLNEDRGASVHCDFCAQEYRFEPAELERLIEEAERRSGLISGNS